MRLFDAQSFERMLSDYDDKKVRGFIEEYGMAGIPAKCEGTLELLHPFLRVAMAEKPSDALIPAQDLVRMAESLNDLVGIFADQEMIDPAEAMGRLSAAKAVRLRRVL